jgi:hypothetical protein
LKRISTALLAGVLAGAICWIAPAKSSSQERPAPSSSPAARLTELLGRRDPAALEELKLRFESEPEKTDRQRIAVVLVRREQEDQRYFDFLAGYAREAVESGMPYPLELDEQGKVVPGLYSAEFLTWAATKKTAPESAARVGIYGYPLDVFLLALTGDSRAAEIFFKGLDAKNPLIVYRAAWGLAKLRINSAVPLIVNAAKRASGEGQTHIARALALFDDPKAQAEAERLIEDKELLRAIRTNAAQELAVTIGEP